MYFRIYLSREKILFKVHIFLEGHKILQNLPLTFDYSTYSQRLGEDFAKFCVLLRIYELYWTLLSQMLWSRRCLNSLNEMGRCSLSKRCSQRLASSSALTIEKLSKNGWLWRQGNVSYDAFYLSSQLSKLYYYCLFFVCFFWSKNRIRNYFSLFMYVYLITIIYSISSVTSVLKREGAALI